MPPRVKFTKDQILETAFKAVREHGIEFLSARNLAALLGTSTAPIFTAFGSIEDLREEIVKKAYHLYTEMYIKQGLKMNPPFKGTGLKYIQFAKDEPKLFKLLFMQKGDGNETSHFLPAKDSNSRQITETVMKSYNMDEESAKSLYNHLSVYTHGLAVLYAENNCVFTMEDVSRMLTEIFTALTKK